MKYVAHTMVNWEVEIEIDEDDTTSKLQIWENALIFYVLGEELSMKTLKKFMVKA